MGETLPVSGDDELLTTIANTRLRLARSGPDRTGESSFEEVSLPMEDGDVLRDLLLEESVRTVIEIGLAYGSSALAIGEALVRQGHHDGKHVIIDAYQHRFANSGWEAISSAGLTNLCTLMTDRSQLALARLMGEEFAADAAFVDGSHIFHNVFVDLFYLRHLVRPGGLIVLDDGHWLSVATAVHYFVVNTGWEPRVIHSPTRLCAYRLPDPRVEPAFESFRPFGIDFPT